MKRILCSFAVVALTVSTMAHDSIIPHTHSTSRDNSDAFIGTVAGLVMLGVTLLLVRALRQSRKS